MTSFPYQHSLFELEAKLAVAVAKCQRYERPAHMVRNCPSDLQDHDQAWRERRNIEYQIRELKKSIDNAFALDK
jgi:hypothetical protein